jgi:hypothetical protein
MKAWMLVFVLLFNIAGYCQTTINGYKYVFVPERFEFSKEDDQYKLNTTAKQLLEKKGFVAIMNNDVIPPAVAANRCIALRAEVTQRKALFTTNLTLVLKDCQGNIIYKGKEGKSREKEFFIAYDEALRDAFNSLNALAYQYDSSLSASPQQVAATPVVSSPASAPSATPAQAPATATPASLPAVSVEITGTLYAQVTANGYQLVDTSPKKVLSLLKTSAQDFYIVEGVSNGVVFKKDNGWLYERYEGGKLVSKKLDIKF